MNITKDFISKKLSDVNEEADFIISAHLSQLDRISNDIRVLEAKLQKAGIPFTFIYVLSSEEKQPTAKEYGYADPYDEIPTSSTSIVYENHCLVWEKTLKNEYRLSYNIYVAADTHVTSYYRKGEKKDIHEGKPVLSSSTPFIETKSNIRLKFEDELPIFYSKLIEFLRNNKERGGIVFPSPNHKGWVSLGIWGLAE
jgi:hypothetical protein